MDPSFADIWYTAPATFRLEISLIQKSHEPNERRWPMNPRGLGGFYGSVLFKFVEAGSDKTHYSGKLSEIFAFGHMDDQRLQYMVLCHQIALVATHLIPNKTCRGESGLRACEAIDITFYLDQKIMPITDVYEGAILTLMQISDVPLRVKIARIVKQEKSEFQKFIDGVWNTSTESLIEQISHAYRDDSDSWSVPIFADKYGAVTLKDGKMLGFMYRHRCDLGGRSATSRLLGPAVFYDGLFEIDLDKMMTSRVLGNHFVLSFAVHLLDQTSCSYVVTNVNRCRSLLMSQREWGSISSNDIGAIQHGVLATFCLVLYWQRKLRGCPVRSISFSSFSCRNIGRSADIESKLCKVLDVFQGYMGAFRSQETVEETMRYDFFYDKKVSIGADFIEEFNKLILQARNGSHGGGMLYVNSYIEVDVSVLLTRFPMNLLVNAGIPFNIHLFAIVEGSKNAADIIDSLSAAGLKFGEDFFRVWGMKNQTRRGKPLFSRIVIESPLQRYVKVWEAITDLRGANFFRKAYALCRWCQFAQGNHIPEQMGGKRKSLLIGRDIRSEVPADLKMEPRPMCLCIRKNFGPQVE